MQKYELMVVYKPLLFEDIKKSTISKLETFVKSVNGTLKEVDNMGKKLLAYPVKKFKEGYYVEYKIELDPSHVSAFKNELNLAQDVLRFLLLSK